MIDANAIFAARSVGKVRYAVVSECSGEFSRVLAKFGLRNDAPPLIEHDREAALGILTTLLWKDMAYDQECMPRHQAETLARQIVGEHERPGSRYFSNGNWGRSRNWIPLTESTFDSGLLIVDHVAREHFCIWFEDED